jgi:putative DNA primase/helicase
MAASAGIVPWQHGQAKAACKRLFQEWIAERGTDGPIEIENGIQQVKRIIERDGASRFTSWLMPSQPTINRLGFVKNINQDTNDEAQIFYVLPEGWKEICQGFDPKLIAKNLVERGVIKPDGDGKFQKVVRLPGSGRHRCYEIHASVLFEEEDRGYSAGFKGNGHDHSALNGRGILNFGCDRGDGCDRKQNQ